MKKQHFLFIFLLFFGVLQAQEKLSKEEKARREKNIQAGNPFVKYGCKAPVATLSKGKYLEVHDLDSIVTIGTMRWHVDKKQIVGRIVRDTLNPDAQPIGDAPGMWMSPDPLSEEFPSWSPYNFVMGNPLRYVDPDGKAPTDIIVLSMTNKEIARVQAPGADIYVKVNEQAFNNASSRMSPDNNGYNTMMSIGSLRSQERNTGRTDLVSEQTGNSLSVTGSMREGRTKIADVNLTTRVDFDNGSHFSLTSFSGVAGGFGNGAPENGSYTVSNFQDRSPSGWFNKGMNNNGVGFSFNLNPQFSTSRTDLRIHPDGNNEGTLGCLGLSGNATQLSSFSSILQSYLPNSNSSFPATINITNNPNNNGTSGAKIPNVNE